MKLTYTIEIDIDRRYGPNVKKDRVSGALINELIRVFGDWEMTVENKRGKDSTDLIVKDMVVWPHEGSEPERMSVQMREEIDGGAPTSKSTGDPVRA